MACTYRILALAALMPTFLMTAAQASDGTVNFGGKLLNETCTVSVNGGSNVGTVRLPTLSTAALGSPGAVGGATSFTIALTGCNAGAAIGKILDATSIGTPSAPKELSSVTAYFEAGPGVDPVSHNILNVGGTATGVQLQLITYLGTLISIGNTYQRLLSNVPFDAGPLNVAGGGSDVVMTYVVRYFANSATTPGSVMGSVTYSIVYN